MSQAHKINNNGPNNYNHAKLEKPIWIDQAGKSPRIQIMAYVEDWKIADKTKVKFTNCTGQCEVISIRVEECGSYYQPCNLTGEVESVSTWQGYNEDFTALQEPGSEPLIYISGMGESPSVMKYKDKWWIIFGFKHDTKSKYNKEKTGRRQPVLILHNIINPGFDPKVLNEIHDRFVKYMRGENENNP